MNALGDQATNPDPRAGFEARSAGEMDEFDVDDAEEFMDAVATDATMTLDHIASKLASYAVLSQ